MGMISPPQNINRAIRTRLSRAVLQALPRPDDAARRFQGLDRPDLRQLSMARFGDCGWREFDLVHGRGIGAGYPRIAAELLADQGVGLRFADVYTSGISKLPQTPAELGRNVRLPADPNLVVLQAAVAHATRTLLPATPVLSRLRELGSHAPPTVARAFYRAAQPTLRRFGDVLLPLPPDAATRIDRFFASVRERWPAAHIVGIGPPRPLVDGCMDGTALAEAERVIAERCEANRVALLQSHDDIASLAARLGAHAVYGGNGFDLRRPAHEVIAAMLVRWIRATVLASRNGNPPFFAPPEACSKAPSPI